MTRIVYNNPRRTQRVNSRRPGGAFDNLERLEIYPALRALLAERLSDAAIAERLGIASKTVMRYRHRHNISNVYGDDRRHRPEES